MNNLKPVLLVEDDKIDAMTVKRAFKELRVNNRLEHVNNGEEAIAYLQDKQKERPCIILLDLNMPKMNGLEFLRYSKNDSKIKMIPVVVMTTSEDEEDKLESFNLGVAGYMLKPIEYAKFVEVVRAIELYWSVSELPPCGERTND